MVSIPYLKSSTKYYYRIVVLLSNGTEVSTQSHFETEESAMYYGEVPLEEMTRFINQLQTYPGSTTQQKVENYLLSIGVTPAEIQSIRDIFLGE